MEPQTTLRDTIADAVETAEAQTQPEVTTETAEQTAERVRDEKGRFARAGEQQEQPEAIHQEAVQQEEPKPVRKPPSSWKKDYWDYWEKIGSNPELAPLQDYLEQRESEFAKGVSTYKSQWDQAAPIYEAIQPFMPELQQYGIRPDQWIQNLGNAHRTLALGTPEQKLQMFAKLATDYGVPLQALTGQPVDPQFGNVVGELTTLKQQLQQFQAAQEMQERAALQQHIEQFKANAPYFEQVKDTMAQLLQSGVATDLQTAYDKAVRLHDDIWQEQQAQQAKREAEERAKQAAEKKAKAVSPKSATPTGPASTGGGKTSLRDTIASLVDEASAGRF